MNEIEAIKIADNFERWNIDDQWLDADEMNEFVNIVKAALEKQIPKKPIKSEKQVIRYVNTYCCPICKLKDFGAGTGIAKWCYHCGQKLDWSDTK